MVEDWWRYVVFVVWVRMEWERIIVSYGRHRWHVFSWIVLANEPMYLYLQLKATVSSTYSFSALVSLGDCFDCPPP